MTLAPDVEAHLGHLNLVEFCRESSRWSGPAGTFQEHDGMVLFATGTPLPVLCNGAFRVDDGVDATALVERADSWFSDLGRGYSIWARTDEDDLVAAVEAAGLQLFGESPEMVCRTRLPDRPPPEGIELRWVCDGSGMTDFAAVSTAAYATMGMPPDTLGSILVDAQRFCAPHVRTVVAYLDGNPVGAAQTLLSHGIAGVYWVGTVEDARGRGVGEAVTRAVTNEAFDLGARLQTLQASQMGMPIYERMGYETIFHYRLYVRWPS